LPAPRGRGLRTLRPAHRSPALHRALVVVATSGTRTLWWRVRCQRTLDDGRCSVSGRDMTSPIPKPEVEVEASGSGRPKGQKCTVYGRGSNGGAFCFGKMLRRSADSLQSEADESESHGVTT
jgi:hypothetical protein